MNIAAEENNAATATATVKQMPSTCRICSTSPLPQNCAVKMDIPLVTPNRNRINRKKIWFASPSAATEVSPSWPTISTSIMFNPALINCWNATGMAIASMARKNTLSRRKEIDIRVLFYQKGGVSLKQKQALHGGTVASD